MTSRLPRDAALVCGAGSLRATAVSLAGVLIAIDLSRRGFSASLIGLVIGAGMTSNAIATMVTGVYADHWGRRRTLLVLATLASLGYAALPFADNAPLLLLVAMAGLVNGTGRDRGPAAALEQAILPSTTSDEQRTWTMAWYNATIDVGHAVGAAAAVLPAAISHRFAALNGHSTTFVLCGAIVGLSAIPYAFLAGAVEPRISTIEVPAASAEPATTRVVRRLTALFALDSAGGGFLSSALVAYWFFERYGVSEAQLAGLFFAARILNVVSHLAAAWLGRRIGLVNTMVFTHLPSSIFLMLAPAASSVSVAVALFLAREALVEMDVPTRQSYVMAVVPPAARTYASSMTNVARNAGWAIGPLLGGSVMQHVALAAPLFIGGSLKVVYDIALFRSFRHLRPPEERPVVLAR